MFSKNTTTVSSEDTEIIDGKNVVPDNCEKYSDEETRGNFVQIDLQNTDTITYEIIYDDSISTFATGNDDIIEPNHLHKYTSVTVKQHEKHSDGSCTTTYYDGDKCTVCGAVWRGDKISETTYVKCPH
ncbi:hypothetical protein IMSAG049_00489 [Clostridiales bacterium]|nr:hypothetical protein IMSAG049_00489 [Clostridiales bacterium]